MELAMLLGAMLVGLSVGLWLEKRQERARREREEQIHLLARRLEPMRSPLRPRPGLPLTGRLTSMTGRIESGQPSASEAPSTPTRRTS